MVQRAVQFTPHTLLSAPRRSAGVPHPSGSKVLYTTTSYSFESHKKDSELRLLDVDTGASLCLAHNEDISDLAWLEGDQFACLCAQKDGTTSLCIADGHWGWGNPDDGWEKRHYVAGKIDAPAGNLKLAKLDGEGNEWAVVVSAQAAKDGSLYNAEKAKKKTHSTGRLYSGLYVRHWDRYETKEKNALWTGKLTRTAHDHKTGQYRLSKLSNALKDTGLECPILPFGGTDNFDLCKECLIFVAKDPDLNPALNVKTNVYILRMTSWDEDRAPTLIKINIPGFEGASTSPVFSPNGCKAAFLSMKKAGYEADKNQIFILSDLSATELSPRRAFASNGGIEGEWDRSPSLICFSADGECLLATAEDYGFSRLFMLKADITKDAEPKALTNRGYISDIKPLPGGTVFVSGSSLIDNSFYAVVVPPNSPEKVNEHEELITWSNSNSGKGNKFGLHPEQVSSIWTPASNTKIRKEIHSIVVKPSDFDSSKRYPVAYFIHGGPQGAWGDNWSTRWNLAVFAEQGYIVIAPNPTGSTGYGQEFTDSIRKNWGGDPYQDIVNCFEWVGENMKEADNEKAVALGGSYGGIQGHDLGRKFKALVCHDGTFSTAGMTATDELYFTFHDLGGTPWYDPGFNVLDKSNPATQARHNLAASTFADWRRWDPAEHLDKWSTPELIIHSENDYRITIADGMSAFNVLQARGVMSQLLTFPNENHWVLKPENSLVWHKVVINWINKFVGLPPFAEEDPDGEEFWGGVREEKEGLVELPTQGKPET